MRRALCRKILRTRLFRSFQVTSRTEDGPLRELIAQLAPLRTEHELIRVGPDGDGGYLVPDDLAGITACFSPGVNTISRFEAECADRGMDVFLADASVDGPAEEHERFTFSKKFLGVTTSDEFMTLDDWAADSLSGADAESDLLLQMDIEGFEYEVLLGMSDALQSRFRMLVIEFHELDQLWSAPFFRLASRAFDKLLQTHACVHIHPNNCAAGYEARGLSIPPVMEFTFLRRDRFQTATPETRFPHPLDADNLARKEVPLPTCWRAA